MRVFVTVEDNKRNGRPTSIRIDENVTGVANLPKTN